MKAGEYLFISNLADLQPKTIFTKNRISRWFNRHIHKIAIWVSAAFVFRIAFESAFYYLTKHLH